ncbi:MAG: DUF4199 family protein [Bacteroidetes bacterium]|nr:DUF4199 family protein [Bacteroidota bacterium]
MNRIILRYGLLSALIICILMIGNMMLLRNGLSYYIAEILGFLGMFLGFSLIYFAVKKLRDEQLKGIISFAQCFQAGLAIVAMATAIYMITWVLYVQFSDFNFTTLYFETESKKIMADKTLNAAEKIKSVAQLSEDIKKMSSLPVQAGIAFFEIFPVGLVISLIVSFILRKK